jgi:hypothetical protein
MSTHKTEFTYKISGEENKVLVFGEVKPIQGLMKSNGVLFEGFGSIDEKPFTEINFDGYLNPKCIVDDIVDFLKKKLKEEHGKKVHFI